MVLQKIRKRTRIRSQAAANLSSRSKQSSRPLFEFVQQNHPKGLLPHARRKQASHRRSLTESRDRIAGR